jgi:hypothetical protein
MPRQYEAIEESYEKRGYSRKEAKEAAARTYIARGKGGNRSSRAKSLHHGKRKSRRKGGRRSARS